MTSMSQEQRASVRAELDNLHKGMVVDMTRRSPPGHTASGAEDEESPDILMLVQETVAALQVSQADIERLQSENEAYLANIADLQGDHDSLTKKNSELTSMLSTARQQISSLSTEITLLRSSVEELSEDRDRFARDHTEAAKILRSNLVELRLRIGS